MRIVVVEDAPELILLTRLLLEREVSYCVTTVGADFEKIQDTIDWHLIDVAIVDRYLDVGYDGIQLLCWLKDAHPSVRRIMLTADHNIQEADACAEQILRKPVEANELLRAVRGA